MSTRKSISAVYHACLLGFCGGRKNKKTWKIFSGVFLRVHFLAFFLRFHSVFLHFSLQKKSLLHLHSREKSSTCALEFLSHGEASHVRLALMSLSLEQCHFIRMPSRCTARYLSFSFASLFLQWLMLHRKISPLSSRNNRTAEIPVLNWTNFICVFVVLFVVSLPLCRIRFWVFPHRIIQNSFQLSCRARRRQRSILFQIFSIAFLWMNGKLCVYYTHKECSVLRMRGLTSVCRETTTTSGNPHE